jgi:hypothetical protein
VPYFYTLAQARILYLKNLSGSHPEKFKGSRISSLLKEHLKQKLADIKRGSNQNKLNNKKHVRSKKQTQKQKLRKKPS